jgi:hypothetical protein
MLKSITLVTLPKETAKILCALSLFALLLSATQVRSRPRTSDEHLHLTRAVVLWNPAATADDSVEQESYLGILSALGLVPVRASVHELDRIPLGRYTLLCIPSASSASLPQVQVARIIQRLKTGLNVVVSGGGPLVTALGITLAEVHPVNVVIDHDHPENNLRWPDHPRVPWISGLPQDASTVLYGDSATGHSLVVLTVQGRGKCMIAAPNLDPISGGGYARFPTLVNAMARYFDCASPFRRQSVDAYFDPGYRYAVSAESLATFWQARGIRAVHAAAWYYNGPMPYNYRELIDAAHRHGVLVYAWLEWPHIGKGFWDLHPEWRQKNALLQDAKFDFLHLMDLQNPDCMNAALDDLGRLLALDWDGVDIAEFTITGAGGEALQGPSRPECFTSFGQPMRREFNSVAGFDPLELENPASPHFWQRDSSGLVKFFEYRRVANNRLLRHVVEFIVDREKKEKRDWELIHTIVDNSLHPEFDRLLGFDLESTLKLVREFGITLNVEDPYMEWDEPPVRYRRLRQTLRALIPDRASMIDINVVPSHPTTQVGFASEQATGAEFLQQLQAAAELQGRVCIYAESSVFDDDWQLVPHAMAAGSMIRPSIKGWDVQASATVTLDHHGEAVPFLDGKRWGCYGPEGIVLPGGRHVLSFPGGSTPKAAARSDLRVEAIDGELVKCGMIAGGVDLVYSSPCRCLITLSSRPSKIFVDGVRRRLSLLNGHDATVIMAPSGTHRLRLIR